LLLYSRPSLNNILKKSLLTLLLFFLSYFFLNIKYKTIISNYIYILFLKSFCNINILYMYLILKLNLFQLNLYYDVNLFLGEEVIISVEFLYALLVSICIFITMLIFLKNYFD